MRGEDQRTSHLFSYLSCEERVPVDHPLRVIRAMTDEALRRVSYRFEALYASTGRPSVAPEHLLRGLCCRCSTRSAPTTGERDAAVSLIASLPSVGGDKGYDTRAFVEVATGAARDAAYRTESEESND